MFRLDICVFTWPTRTLFKPIFKLLADLEQVGIHMLGSDGCVDGLEYYQGEANTEGRVRKLLEFINVFPSYFTQHPDFQRS